MRVMQGLVGLAVIIVGLGALLIVNGWLAFNSSDIAAGALFLSALFFIVPALVWRRTLPWITSLLLPGMLALACGAILLYAGRTYWAELAYLWVLLILALGLGFLGMYYLGPRAEWLRIVGTVTCAVGLFSISIALVLFSSVAAARITGSVILILLGIAVAVCGFGRGRSPTQLTPLSK